MWLAPQIITAGTVSVTQYSNIVQLDPVAFANLNGVNNPILTQRQFRCGLGGGTIYNIQSMNANLQQVTLDRIYMEGSQSGQPYQVYRCYYLPCDQNGNYVDDFVQWKVLLNAGEGYAIVGENLRMTQAELDARDPQRADQDLAYAVASRGVNPDGLPIFEMWPHPTSQNPYIGLYQRRGTDFNSTNPNLPKTFKEHTVTQLALMYGLNWAMLNQGRFPELKGVDLALAKAEATREFKESLDQARRMDDEIQCDDYLVQMRDYLAFPIIDSAFLQSHDAGNWFSD